jgi:hypothetical protein
MILIHTALLSEAQSLIEYYKLNLIQKNPRIYQKQEITLVVSGIGKQNTIKALSFLDIKHYTKAINIGIAGCSNTNIPIGTIFSFPNKIMTLKTVDNPIVFSNDTNTLFDMEAKYFYEYINQYLHKDNICIFKIVSDYLDNTIPNKEFVKQLIWKNISKIFLHCNRD